MVTFLTINISLFAQQPAKTRADKQFEKAAQMYNRHDYAGSLRQLDELILDEPSYAKAWLLKADIYYDLQDYPGAVASYKKAVLIDSVIFPPAYYIMANLYFDMEKYDDAKINYLTYLTFKPKVFGIKRSSLHLSEINGLS